MLPSTTGAQTHKSFLGWGWVGGVGWLAPLNSSNPTNATHPPSQSISNHIKKIQIKLEIVNAPKHDWCPNSQKFPGLGVGGWRWLAGALKGLQPTNATRPPFPSILNLIKKRKLN